MTSRLAAHYRQQHAELSAIIQHIDTLLSAPEARTAAARVRADVEALAHKLNDHLTRQEEGVYTRLLYHTDTQVRDTARHMRREMGAVRKDFDRFVAAWASVPLMTVRFPTFAAEARTVTGRLSAHLNREEETLPPLAEKAGL